MKARRRFSQNFLIDPGVTAKVIEALAPAAGQAIIEIGPGKGALTRDLAASGAQLTAIEIDRDLAARLARALPEVNLVTEDVLKLDLAGLLASRPQARIVGNLPYRISTPLLFRLFAVSGALADMHFMLQLEVAERMTAQPGVKAYGRLSVMTAFHCQAEILFHVPPEAFAPAPRVTSALVRLVPRRQKPAVPEALLGELVSHAFTLRRKTLRHSLGKYLDAGRLAALGLDPGLRAETLALDDFVRCAQAAAG